MDTIGAQYLQPKGAPNARSKPAIRTSFSKRSSVAAATLDRRLRRPTAQCYVLWFKQLAVLCRSQMSLNDSSCLHQGVSVATLPVPLQYGQPIRHLLYEHRFCSLAIAAWLSHAPDDCQQEAHELEKRAHTTALAPTVDASAQVAAAQAQSKCDMRTNDWNDSTRVFRLVDFVIEIVLAYPPGSGASTGCARYRRISRPANQFSCNGTFPVGPERSVVTRTTSSERKLMLMDVMSEFDASNRNCRIGQRLEAFH
jgi:hypothetical protein